MENKSLYEADEEKKILHKTKSNTFDMFPIGSRVQVITVCQDFYFFFDETGVVTSNTGKYLGINVVFDKPRHFEDGYVQKDFGFNPSDLKRIDIDFNTNLT